jgi:head-tail adaptor
LLFVVILTLSIAKGKDPYNDCRPASPRYRRDISPQENAMPYRWTPAGEMRSAITIQSPSNSNSQDAAGQPSTGPWTTLYAGVSAKATCRGGSEQFAQDQFQPRRTWEIRIRYLPGISELNGILLGPDAMDSSQHYLDIQYVEDIEYKHRELLLSCIERVNWVPFGDS